jgi:hypothetical protein
MVGTAMVSNHLWVGEQELETSAAQTFNSDIAVGD